MVLWCFCPIVRTAAPLCSCTASAGKQSAPGSEFDRLLPHVAGAARHDLIFYGYASREARLNIADPSGIRFFGVAHKPLQAVKAVTIVGALAWRL